MGSRYMSTEVEQLHQRDKTQSAALEQAVKFERESRLTENSELHARLDAIANIQPSGALPATFIKAKANSQGSSGNIATLYGMVNEALGGTSRLSVEIDQERQL